jgi:hypothetical protein
MSVLSQLFSATQFVASLSALAVRVAFHATVCCNACTPALLFRSVKTACQKSTNQNFGYVTNVPISCASCQKCTIVTPASSCQFCTSMRPFSCHICPNGGVVSMSLLSQYRAFSCQFCTNTHRIFHVRNVPFLCENVISAQNCALFSMSDLSQSNPSLFRCFDLILCHRCPNNPCFYVIDVPISRFFIVFDVIFVPITPVCMSFLSQFGPHLCRFCPNRFLVFMSSVSPIQRPPSCELSKVSFFVQISPLRFFSTRFFRLRTVGNRLFYVRNVPEPCRKCPFTMSETSQKHVSFVPAVCRRRPNNMSETSPTDVRNVPDKCQRCPITDRSSCKKTHDTAIFSARSSLLNI